LPPTSGPFMSSVYPPEATQRGLVTSSMGAYPAQHHRGLLVTSGAALALSIGAIVAFVVFYKKERTAAPAVEGPTATASIAPSSPPAQVVPTGGAVTDVNVSPPLSASAASPPAATASAAARVPHGRGAPPQPSAASTPTRRVPPEIRSPFE